MKNYEDTLKDIQTAAHRARDELLMGSDLQGFLVVSGYDFQAFKDGMESIANGCLESHHEEATASRVNIEELDKLKLTQSDVATGFVIGYAACLATR